MTGILLTVVRSLSFDEDRSSLLSAVPPEQWEELLGLTDAAHITAALAARCRHAAPESARARLDACLARSAERYSRVLAAHVEITGAMKARRIDFLVLKGLTHSGFWHGDPRLRPQYDVDLYVPPCSIDTAFEAMSSIGYEPTERGQDDADHLPVMVRRTGWRWRGDYYDPEQPLALELHFRFWNPNLGFGTRGADGFWNRRTVADFDGISLPALHRVDRLRYAAWHAVRHLLRGTLRILHVYELAYFLNQSSDDHTFWQEWREEGEPADRLAESIGFRLASEWFSCRMNAAAREYAQSLPANIGRWFTLFAFSPITGITHPNKDELFLNLCLAQDGRGGREVAARRVLPRRLPSFVLDAHDQTVTFQLRLRRGISRTAFIANRAVHHVRTLPPLLGSGIRWWCSR